MIRMIISIMNNSFVVVVVYDEGNSRKKIDEIHLMEIRTLTQSPGLV